MTLAHMHHTGQALPHQAKRDRVAALLTRISAPATLDLAEEMLEMLTADEHLSTQNLTVAEINALERMGVSETDLRTPTSLVPLLRGRLHEQALESESFTAQEVADRLGVTTTRVRQRAAEGSLIARRLSDGWRFPTFQFTEDGELPGWSTVARAVVPGTPLTLAHDALTRPTSLLVIGGHGVSVAEWLLAGGDLEQAATAFDTLLNRIL